MNTKGDLLAQNGQLAMNKLDVRSSLVGENMNSAAMGQYNAFEYNKSVPNLDADPARGGMNRH